MENTDIDTQNPSLAPFCSPVPGTTLLNAFAEVARTNPLLLSTGSMGSEDKDERATQRQLRHVLELMVVLWGDLPSQCSSGTYMSTLKCLFSAHHTLFMQM